MAYTLGLDLGTTSSAAALSSDDDLRVLSFDQDLSVVPSVVHLSAEGEWLVGAAAARRARSDPEGAAREFKRRFGDPTPLLLNGTPVAANDLMLRLASFLVDESARQLGDRPDALVVCHPANWGDYKAGLLADTLSGSTLPPQRLLTEPEAAAIAYASQERVAPATTVAVYDLGGGTFDVALLRKTDSGWDPIGRPGGVERLGGIDFDTALFHHVIASAGIQLADLDQGDAANQAGVERLRTECIEAKHALSHDVAAAVPILLPTVNETVRVTRAEFERLIDPVIGRTLEAFDATLESADLTFDDIDRVLLVGGSSRIPLVAQRVAAHTNRPIATDAHPKHIVALGAAMAGAAGDRPADPSAVSTGDGYSATLFQDLPHISEAPLPDFVTRRPAYPLSEPPIVDQPTQEIDQSGAAAIAADAPTTMLPGVAPTEPRSSSGAPPADQGRPGRRRWALIAGGAGLALAITLIVLGLTQDGAGDGAATTTTSAATTTDATTETTAPTTVATIDSPCSADQLPDAGIDYRIVFIPASDEDGGLNGRAGPSLDDDVITVFPSLTTIEVTGVDCEPDESGRVWWGVDVGGQVVWASSRFIEPVP